MTPWQVGFVSEVLRALARRDREALERVALAPPWPWSWLESGAARLLRAASAPDFREALGPWSGEGRGARTFMLRCSGDTTLARFAERGEDVLVVVVVRRGDAKVEAVRVMSRAHFEAFGELVV